MNIVFKSHGKLLISGEYFVMKGAKSLCIPTKFNQILEVNKLKEKKLVWKSLDENNNIWVEGEFRIPNLKIISGTSKELIFLLKILIEAKKLNNDFLDGREGFIVKSLMNFNKNWGLGSSSTLIVNISKWAKVDSFKLFWSVLCGSGYDIASAITGKSILYKNVDGKPVYNIIKFNPVFHENLFFVYQNRKQNTSDEIEFFNKKSVYDKKIIDQITKISERIINCTTLDDFKSLIQNHEELISNKLGKPKIKQLKFPDYEGELKSLGAWGGDFILAAGPKNSKKYFVDKGYNTVIPFNEMLKKS